MSHRRWTDDEPSRVRVCQIYGGHCVCGGLDMCPQQQRQVARDGWADAKKAAREWLEKNGLRP